MMMKMIILPNCSLNQKPSISPSLLPPSKLPHLSSSNTPLIIPTEKLKPRQIIPLKIHVLKNLKTAWMKLLDGFVDSVFQFSDQTLHPNQSNFAPVEEMGAAVDVTNIQGTLPQEFPQGIYLRNGGNPLFGGLKWAKSVFGRSSFIWVEGEGMLHALYFKKADDTNNNDDAKWKVFYNNRFVQTDTFRLEKHEKKRPCFLPTVEGDSLAVLFAFLLNWLRFGKFNKDVSNTNVFEHSGKFYSVAENHLPHEMDINTLQTLGNWDVNGSWNNRPFTSHPQKAPETGELVIMGVTTTKPFMEVGVISGDGKRMVHKVDVKLSRSSLSHEIGVTKRYNVILDYALTMDFNRLIRGGVFLKYDKLGYSRIGVMPRYGDGDSIQWFDVKPNCSMHLFNCFEHNDEVVVWGCRASDSVIPGPEKGVNKFDWFCERFKQNINVEDNDDESSLVSRPYQWRLNLKTGEVKEEYLTATSMDFPFINLRFTGLPNKFGYAQVLDSVASSNSGMFKFGGLAKLHFEEPRTSDELSPGKKCKEEEIKVEYHMLEHNSFCSGASFVPRENGDQEDDGWIIAHVHNEITNTSQVYIIDAQKFNNEPIAKISLPQRVPYGFHGAFMPISWNKK
ncbi:carotenoid 9,10(9',10')-cleavage dioxygenase 1-like [Benincasa hispida]|uniref:carotenoid 9,10(9',10')-cleavage dioxygenase 1-like n=1 Tax=Benincasa hispida TaxID=102211 RepID=UPI0019003F5E|nr:carotenoid 9,10(9',10')-cleavage dioxygenase 1-like [Benincasa hispida]